MNKKPIVKKETHAVLPVDLDLFKILSLTKHKRLSKTEAFFWLIGKILEVEAESDSKSNSGFSIFSIMEDQPLKGNAFLTSYSELAKQWGWSRNTVSSFLGKLKESYIISLVKTPEGVYITGAFLYFCSFYLTHENVSHKDEEPPQPEMPESESSEEDIALPENEASLLPEESKDAEPFA